MSESISEMIAAHYVRSDRSTGWQPLSSAPRDGTVVELTWMDDGKPQEIWPMQWAHIQRNDLFASGVVGMWVVPDGSLTWTEHNPDGAPTHWRTLR